MKRSRRRPRHTSSFSGSASLFCVALVVVRNVHTGNVNFRYLIWNLFLAWIPFVLAVLCLRPLAAARRGGDAVRARRALAAVLPERAVHRDGLRPPAATTRSLRSGTTRSRSRRSPGWGSLLGFASLYLDADRRAAVARRGGRLGVRRRRDRPRLARDLPRPLPPAEQLGRARASAASCPRICTRVARDPFAYQEAIAVTLLFTLALTFAYFLLYSLAAVGPRARRRALTGARPGRSPRTCLGEAVALQLSTWPRSPSSSSNRS